VPQLTRHKHHVFLAAVMGHQNNVDVDFLSETHEAEQWLPTEQHWNNQWQMQQRQLTCDSLYV